MPNNKAIEVKKTGYIELLRQHAEANELNFGEYERQCVANAIRTLDPIIRQSEYVWDNFSKNNVMGVLQQVAFLKINPSATPREGYFIIRKNWDKKNNKALPPTVEFGVEGAGNDVILREFGTNVKEVKSYVVYEGDEFELGGMDGWDYKLPNYSPKFKSRKALFVVYLIKLTTGEIDVSIADREAVKVSLLANAKQNGAEDKLLWELNKLSLDEILENPKWRDYEISKTYGSKTYKTPLFNPSYTSPISMESMIERKMRNHATRKYPKSFNPESQKLYENTFEDEKYIRKTIIEEKDEDEIIEDSKKDYIEHANKNDLSELEVTQEELHDVKNNDDFEEKQEEEQEENINIDETTGEVIEDIVEEQEEEIIEEKQGGNNTPDWL